MENNEKKTALEFETLSLSGFSFESSDTPPLDETAKEAPTPAAEGKPEDIIPDSFELSFADEYESEKAKSEPEIIDEPKVRRPYIPKFTEASARYSTAEVLSKTIAKTVTKAQAAAVTARPEVRPSVDPTAELEDDRAVKKVMVTTGASSDEAFLDESIKIYKFEGDAVAEDKKKIPVANKPVPEEDYVPLVPKPESEEAEPIAEEKPSEPAQLEAEEALKKEEKLLPTPFGKVAEGEEPKGSRGEALSKRGRLSEYSSLPERDSFKDRFLDALTSVKIRLTAIVLIILSLIASEIVFLTLSPINMVGFLTGGGVLVDLLFSTALFALSIPEVYRGVKRLFGGVLAPEVFLPLSYILILVYTLTAASFGPSGAVYMHFSLPFSLGVFYSALASYFRISAEFKSFKLISTGRDMWVLDKRFTRTLERENIALDGAVDEYRSKISRVFRTSFVSDFCENTERVKENSANTATLLGISLGTALVSGVITFFLADSALPLLSALEAFLAVFFFSVPSAFILSRKFFFNRLIKREAKSGRTFIGESAVYDTAEVDVIAYDDTEALGGAAIKKMHLYGKVYNTEKAMMEMYSLFSTVGGPLVKVFSASLDRKCPSAESVTLFDDGIVGYFGGHRVMAGSYDFMVRNNARIPEDDGKALFEPMTGVKVMYGAEDGEVFVKFFIKYSFADAFSTLLPDFKRYNIVPLIYTRDPNVDGELLRTLTDGEDRIRAFKLRDLPLPTEVYSHISSDSVSLADKLSVPSLLTSAREYRALSSIASAFEMFTMLAGAAASSLTSLFLMGGLSRVPTLVYLIWQLIPLSLFSVLPRAFDRLKEKNKE